MSNRPLKPMGLKPKITGLPNSRQELKARLGANIIGTAQKRTLLTAQPPNTNVSKRPKLDFKSASLSMPSSSSSMNIAGASSSGFKSQLEIDLNFWKEYSSGTEINPKTFELHFAAAKENNKQHKMARMVCAAMKEQLMLDEVNEMNTDLLNQVIKVTSEEEQLLKNNNVVIAVFCMLNKLPGTTTTQQLLRDQFVSVLNAAIAQPNVSWPLVILNLAINDCLGARNWVDRADTQSVIVQIVSSLFGPLHFPSEQACSACDLPFMQRETFNGPSKFNKPAEEIESVLKYIIEFFEKQIRIDANVSKNLLKTLAICSSNPKIRCLCAQKLDAWLQNGKLQNCAKELLLYIASNTKDSSSDANLEVLLCLVRLRGLRSKQTLHVFQAAIRDLLCECPGCLPVLVNLIMDNEFSPNKFQHNMAILHLLFNCNFVESSDLVSKILIKRIENADNVKSVRLFLRDFVRSISQRADFSFSALAKAMFASFRKASQHIPRQLQDQFLRCCIDVCSILPFVGITTGLKESVSSLNRKQNTVVPLSFTQIEAISKFHAQTQQFMAYSMDFLKWSKKSINVDHQTAMKAYYMLLYLGSHSYYTSIETWPTEAEFNQFIRVIAECPIEESLINALIENWSDMLGGSMEERKASHASVILTADLISILETLTKRCFSVRGFDSEGNSLLLVRNLLTIERLFNVIKENIAADRKKQMQRQFSNKNLYWRVWFLTVAWSCLNHTTLLKLVYDKYPLLRIMISMALTKDYNFPPPLLDVKQVEQILAEDKQEHQLELQILKDCDLPVDEENEFSYCFNNPSGKLRKPAPIFTDQLRSCNEQFDLRSVLLSIENPDLLNKLNYEQGAVRSMPVIVQMLLSNSSQTIRRIPLQSLCQLVVQLTDQKSLETDPTVSAFSSFPIDIKTKLFQRLRNILLDSNQTEEENVRIAIKYLLASLAAPLLSEREACFSTLQRLLSPYIGDMEIDFSLDMLTNIFHFGKLSSEICEELSKCCLIENNKERLEQYIQFITKYAAKAEDNQQLINKIASNLCNLVKRVSENSLNNHQVRDSLIQFYATYIQQLCKTVFSDQETCSDMLLHVSISGSKHMEFNISAEILETILELLCETFGDDVESICESRKYLIEIFFPISVSENTLSVVKANDREMPVDILPKKLKMKMLSSHDERVIKIALEGVNSKQAVDFIQSFALSTFSCTHLLSIINKSEFGNGESARSAIPFVRAYKQKGAQGAEEFLNAMKKFDVPEEMEHRNEFKPSKLCPDLSVHQYSAELINGKSDKMFDSTTQIAEYFNELLEGGSSNSITISPTFSNLIACLRNNDEFVKFAISFVTPRIAQFTQLPNVLSPLVLAFMGVAAKNSCVHSQLRTLKDRAKKCGQAKFVANMLCSFHPKSHAKQAQQSKATSKGNFSCEQMQADEIVRLLVGASTKKMTDLHISGLLERLQILRPEIVTTSLADFTNQVAVFFGSSSPPIINLISQMTVCSSVSTLRKIMVVLLGAFDYKLLPDSVLKFVSNCCARSCRVLPTKDQSSVLLNYFIAQLTNTHQGEWQEAVDKLLIILQFLIERHSGILPFIKDKLQVLFTQHEYLLSEEGKKKFKAIQFTTDSINCSYPGISKKWSIYQIGLDVHTLPITEIDDMLHKSISDMFSMIINNDKSTEELVSEAMANLLAEAKCRPKVIARQIPLLSVYITNIAQMNTRHLKDTKKTNLLKLLELTLDVIIQTTPFSLADPASIQFTLQSYFNFFETNSGRTAREWKDLVDKILTATVKFLEFDPIAAKKFLVKNLIILKAFETKFKEKTELVALIENLPYSNILVEDYLDVENQEGVLSVQ